MSASTEEATLWFLRGPEILPDVTAGGDQVGRQKMGITLPLDAAVAAA